MLEPGSILGAYRIVRSLGRGGMGCVYEAEHVELRARRAIKVFGSDSDYAELLRKRFVAEGRILADLRHPRIVRVYDFAVDDATGSPYFAMDLVVSPTGEPRTLEEACRDGVDESRIAGWFRDICEGLDYIHSKGVVHRDISLDNILIGPDGHAVLTDFGIAKITGEAYRRQIDITKTMPQKDGSCLSWGKGLYMAPELRKGCEATPASDAYALGVILFRVLAGSWYTPAVRLADALAGLEYNWSAVVARLCAVEPESRLGADGFAGAVALLRQVQPSARRRRAQGRLFLLFFAGIVLLSLLVAFRGNLFSPTPAATSPASSLARGSDIIHIVDVTNYIPQTVYEIIPVTNHVSTGKSSGN